MDEQISVLVVEDHPVMLEGLHVALARDGFDVVGAAATSRAPQATCRPIPWAVQTDMEGSCQGVIRAMRPRSDEGGGVHSDIRGSAVPLPHNSDSSPACL
ncbi:MAG TPA: hypothetical protein VET26_06910 [Candidatus Sulfotelmatobacter sp.]|nr:hypothetical protein [Candidatus Sulfotelmatobacter sp.]